MPKLLDRLSLYILRLSIRIDHVTDPWCGRPRSLAIRLSMKLERWSDRLYNTAHKKKAPGQSAD